MSLRLTPLVCLAFFLSCTKENHQSTPVGAVSFTADGTNYSWSEVTDDSREDFLTMSIAPAGTGAYRLSATNEFSAHLHPLRMVYLTMFTSTLTTNTPFTLTNQAYTDIDYTPNQISVSNYTVFSPESLFSAFAIGDFATITITSVHDNRADGTFSARMSRYSDSSSVNITNGEFKNVSIEQ